MAQVADLDGHRNGISGSLASSQLPAAASSAVYNADNQLTQWGSTTMTYDADGNTLNDGTNTYTWDARNDLVSANNDGASFVYDGLGRRFGKTMLGANTNFLYDGLNPVQELNGTAPTANLLTGGLDERFTRTDSTGTFSYLTDALGSTIALTDSTGNSDVQYSYDPYGSMSITGTTTNSYAYTGREFDGLGIDYYRARYYNPTTGRFISEDPMGLAAGPNEYAYVGDDPIDFIDTFGLDRAPNNKTLPLNPLVQQQYQQYKQCLINEGTLNVLTDLDSDQWNSVVQGKGLPNTVDQVHTASASVLDTIQECGQKYPLSVLAPNGPSYDSVYPLFPFWDF